MGLTMYEDYSDQYGTPSVVVLGLFDDMSNAEEIISYARDIGAETRMECEPDEPADLVIDFRSLRSPCGPEVYTEEAVRATVIGSMNRVSAGVQ